MTHNSLRIILLNIVKNKIYNSSYVILYINHERLREYFGSDVSPLKHHL